MSNLPATPFMGPPQNVNASQLNHNQLFNTVPLGQLPPGFGGLKRDANSNSPLPPTSAPYNNAIGQVYSHSASSSPAFNHPGMMPPNQGMQPSPVRPQTNPIMPPSINQNPLPPSIPSVRTSSANASPAPHPPVVYNFQRQINDNAPPLISSSHSQPLLNGPVVSQPLNQFPASSAFGPTAGVQPPSSIPNFGLVPGNSSFGQQSQRTHIPKPPAGPMSPPNVPFSGPPHSVPPLNGPLIRGPPVSGPPIPGPPVSGPPISGPPLSGPPVSGPPLSGPPISGPPLLKPHSFGPPTSGPPISGPPIGPPTIGPPMTRLGINGPSNLSAPLGPTSGPLMGPPKGQGLPSGPTGQPLNGPPVSGPPVSQSYPGLYNNGPPVPPVGPMGRSPMGQPTITQGQMPPLNQGQMPPISQSQMPPIHQNHIPPMSQGQMPPMAHQMGPPIAPGPASGPQSNMQPRYPQTNYNHQPVMAQPHSITQYPQQYNTQGVTQQMGQLSVTKQGFDQLWGHQMVDLLTCRQILPEYPENPPEIRLAHQFAGSPNCSPEVFRCTVNRIPETNSLLQKSRLPLGILIHPFKDLNHLPVIQCTSIVRCRACRTYINPFVYFVDAKRWKCNLCFRVNDLPEEFQYDPVSKSYGDPSRRPEIKSATIEFIAPGEYMLRPPQPAVYLFLLDVSQIARDSGYLQIVCDTLKSNLDQLPGDARTQVGFVCFDAHVHYYLMSDGLTRPKEMTVIDIDEVFLPSPESLLVNLGERRELVRELLTVLPARHAGPGQPASALGAALQAAYKLMAPTGGRVTVFQTCLPNVGPGALQPREDPNARSSADVAHLNPATDFYKRLALDCSGAQIAVDLFLLNAQYADLATLSGMSKFSGGTMYHIPLFRAARPTHSEQLARMLARYITRKIGFEAVMRVRCTRGISIHTFHGNFFVRSTDLLSLPNVSPDAGFGMQLAIEESLSDVQHVCFQAALLYTSSKGERRIRVHTLALPLATTLPDVLHSADQECIIGLLSKMAVDRCASASMPEAREALINVAVDALSAFKLAQNLPAGAAGPALHAPLSLRLLPLYLLALLKRRAFRTGTSTRLDDRVADMCAMKTLPLSQLLRAVYPVLYPLHELRSEADGSTPDPRRLHLSAERINSNGVYLLDDGETMIIYVCHAVSPAYLSDTFGVAAFSQLPDEARSLPALELDGNELLHAFIDNLNEERPYASNLLVLRDNSPNRLLFTERLVDDRVESAFAYYEFLQHIKAQVK